MELAEGEKMRLLPMRPVEIAESDDEDNGCGFVCTPIAHEITTPPLAAQASLYRVWLGGLVAIQLGLPERPSASTELDPASSTISSAERRKRCTWDFPVDEQHPTFTKFYEVKPQGIGQGSFGLACPAIHRASQTHCIVKVVTKVGSSENTERKEKLLRMHHEFPHPNIVRYLDMLEGPKLYFTVMEHLLGPELFDHILEAFPIPEATCRSWSRQVLSALHHLHTKMFMIHRDVKLENLRFRSPMSVTSPLVLLDFGCASFISEEADDQIAGTFGFLPPEEVAVILRRTPRKVGPAVDIWAAGVVLYILFAGQLPFEDDDIPALAGPTGQAALEQTLSRLESTGRFSSEALNLLSRLMDHNASTRPSALEALQHPWLSSTESRMPDGSQSMPVAPVSVKLSRSQASRGQTSSITRVKEGDPESCPNGTWSDSPVQVRRGVRESRGTRDQQQQNPHD